MHWLMFFFLLTIPKLKKYNILGNLFVNNLMEDITVHSLRTFNSFTKILSINKCKVCQREAKVFLICKIIWKIIV